MLLFALLAGRAGAQYDPHAAEPIAKLRGALLLHGGGPISAAVADRFVQLAGGEQARIVVVGTASADPEGEDAQQDLQLWRDRKPASVELLHATTRAQADVPEFGEPLRQATGVWFTGGRQSRLAERYAGTTVEPLLREVIDRGGVVGGTGAGAAALGKVMIAGGESQAELATGLDLLPKVVIDQHFLTRDRQPRLMHALQLRPGLVGLGIDEGTALVVRGRSLSVVGESCAVVCLAASKSRPPRIERLIAGKSADLIALSRAAAARALPEFPSAEPPPPEVTAGAW